MFVLIFVNLRYYRGPRFESYYVFTHPWVIFFTAWLVWRLFSWQRLAGIGLLTVLLIGGSQQIVAHYQVEKNNLFPLVKGWQQTLTEMYPGQKFAPYDYRLKTRTQTAALALALDTQGLVDEKGVKVGVTRQTHIGEELFTDRSYRIIRMTASQSASLDWKLTTPEAVWQETEAWWR